MKRVLPKEKDSLLTASCSLHYKLHWRKLPGSLPSLQQFGRKKKITITNKQTKERHKRNKQQEEQQAFGQRNEKTFTGKEKRERKKKAKKKTHKSSTHYIGNSLEAVLML